MSVEDLAKGLPELHQPLSRSRPSKWQLLCYQSLTHSSPCFLDLKWWAVQGSNL